MCGVCDFLLALYTEDELGSEAQQAKRLDEEFLVKRMLTNKKAHKNDTGV